MRSKEVVSMALTPVLILLRFLASPPAGAAILTQIVNYQQGAAALQGYLAYDDSIAGPRPGVLVLHEWWGHGPYVRRRAEALAKLGYIAFAADMYGKGVYAQTHEEAKKLSGALRADRKLMRERALAGLDFLKTNPLTDSKRVAAIGYCFGGSAALELARAGTDLAGVVSFHGALDTPHPEETKSVKAKVLVLAGADDKWTTPNIPEFEDEMRRAGADWQLVLYGGAVHSFTVPEAGDDPSKGMAYNLNADLRSWQAMREFFSEIFR